MGIQNAVADMFDTGSLVLSVSAMQACRSWDHDLGIACSKGSLHGYELAGAWLMKPGELKMCGHTQRHFHTSNVT